MRGIAVYGFAVAAAGCADSTAPDSAIALPPVWRVQLDHHAVTLSTASPYDTARLVATPRDTGGRPVTVAMRPHFIVSDSSLSVDSMGFVRANFPTNGSYVVAVLSANNITYRDSAYFTITTVAVPPVVDTFTIHPLAGDSAKFAIGGAFMQGTFVSGKSLMPHVTDASGDPITGVQITYETSDYRIATVNRAGGVEPVAPGKVLVTASALIYGVSVTDTLTYTVGLPLFTSLNIIDVIPFGQTHAIPTVTPQGTITLGVGAEIAWSHTSRTPSGLIFDDSTNVAPEYDGFGIDPTGLGGNIAPFAKDATHPFPRRVRSFPHPGVYTYYSTVSTVRDTIIIQSEH